MRSTLIAIGLLCAALTTAQTAPLNTPSTFRGSFEVEKLAEGV